MKNAYIHLLDGKEPNGPVIGPVDIGEGTGSGLVLRVGGHDVILPFKDGETVFDGDSYSRFEIEDDVPFGEDTVCGMELLEKAGVLSGMSKAKIADMIVGMTEYAYMRDSASEKDWRAIVVLLLDAGVSPGDVQWILESKNMRWAADCADSAMLTLAVFKKHVAKTNIVRGGRMLVGPGKKESPADLRTRYAAYRAAVDDGNGLDIVTGHPVPTFKQWIAR